MSEGFRADPAGRHALQAIVANRGSRIQRLFHIRLIHDIALSRRVAPHAREAIGLQLQADRQRIRLLGTSLLKPMHSWFDAKQFLNVVTQLMSDHVSLRELTRRAKTRTQLVEKGEIEIDLLVFRAIKRTNRILSYPASRRVGFAKQHQLGVAVGNMRLVRQDAAPVTLHIIENERNELHLGLFALIARVIGPGLDGRRARWAAQERKEIAMKQQAENTEQNKASAADVKTAKPEAPAATAVVPPVLDIAADAARSPFHAPSLPDNLAAQTGFVQI